MLGFFFFLPLSLFSFFPFLLNLKLFILFSDLGPGGGFEGGTVMFSLVWEVLWGFAFYGSNGAQAWMFFIFET